MNYDEYEFKINLAFSFCMDMKKSVSGYCNNYSCQI